MTPREKIAALFEAIEKLDQRDREFASSLCAQFSRKGDLTSRQWPWIDTLLERATGPKVEKPREQVGDLSKLQALFDTARKRLKRPAIVLQLDGIGTVRVAEAGARARVPGSLNVTDNTGYGGKWFGRILKDGTFDTGFKGESSDALMAGLRAFAENPAQKAADHGKLTGRCCFCDLHLDTDESTAVGYGPVCAKNYGLPWGKRAAKAARAEDVERQMQLLEAQGDREQTIRDEQAKHQARTAMEAVA